MSAAPMIAGRKGDVVLSDAMLRDMLWDGEIVPACEHGDFRSDGKGQMICERCKTPAVPRSTRKVSR
jgi:hypothetical protein